MIQLYNSLTRCKEPLPEKETIGMYVCGPTVYSRPHLGNARSIVVYDVLYRLLCQHYGKEKVTYVRNITDVDDKINAAAIERGISIQALTSEVTTQFHEDVAALGCLPPTIEPRATGHVSEIIDMVEKLLASGHAYENEAHVLFDVTSPATDNWHYGMLSGRKSEEQEAGARVAVESYKRHPGDFVLWKPADAEDDASSVFDSPWGKGRPGWHIECSAMSTRYLGANFDIHGGGADLKFPHHENEIAQSACANPGSHYARFWVHNGFLTIHGEKMSKSLGNFTTVYDVLQRGVAGEVIRFTLLSAHYAKPLDWTDKLLEDSAKQLEKLYNRREKVTQSFDIPHEFLSALQDDMNVPKAISLLHTMPDEYLKASAALLGLLQAESNPLVSTAKISNNTLDATLIEKLIQQRAEAKTSKNWAEADRIRNELKMMGVELVDKPGGVTEWVGV